MNKKKQISLLIGVALAVVGFISFAVFGSYPTAIAIGLVALYFLLGSV